MGPLGLSRRHLERAPSGHAPKQGLTRRRLLVRGVLAAGTVGLVSAVLRFASKLRHDPSPGRRALSGREEGILAAVLITLFPGAEGMPAADPERLIPAIDAHLADMDADARLLFRTMLHVIEDHAVVFSGARFSRLSPADRARELRAWEATDVYVKRVAFSSVKFVCGLQYMEQPEAREAIGWYLGCSPGHLLHLSRRPVGV